MIRLCLQCTVSAGEDYKKNDFISKCPICGSENICLLYNLSDSDLSILCKISVDKEFLTSMDNLKKENPIDYQLKMSQFKTQLEQIRASREREMNVLHCPKCGSTNITTGARGINAFWGPIGASKTVNRCAKCGYTWKP